MHGDLFVFGGIGDFGCFGVPAPQRQVFTKDET
jgi:hypothetical protein